MLIKVEDCKRRTPLAQSTYTIRNIWKVNLQILSLSLKLSPRNEMEVVVILKNWFRAELFENSKRSDDRPSSSVSTELLFSKSILTKKSLCLLQFYLHQNLG